MKLIHKIKAWNKNRLDQRYHILSPGELTAGYWRNRVSVFWSRVIISGTFVAIIIAIASVKSNDVRFCDGLKSNRDVLTRLVERAYTPSAGSFDLKALNGYELIKDSGTKQWVDSFNTIIAFSSTSGQGTDKNKNHVPDDIDKILREKVC